MNIYIK